MDMVKIFEQLLKSMEGSIDRGEVQVIEMITKEQENISVENCRKVFAEIEKSKLELSNTTETLLEWLQLLLEYTNSD
jgi:hypothetical protein